MNSMELLASYAGVLASGGLITIQLLCLSFLLAAVSGTALAVLTQREAGPVWWCWRIYRSVFTGVPSLVIVFLIFTTGPQAFESLAAMVGLGFKLSVSPFGAGVAALGLVYSAYFADLVRSGIRQVPRGQLEAAQALSIGRLDLWRLVMLPQAARFSLPGIVNLWVVMLKDTALVSMVGLNDIIAKAKTAAGSTKQSFLFFSTAGLFFILLSVITIRYSDALRQRLEKGQRVAGS